MSDLQHKMYHDPDLRIYFWPELSAGERLASPESTKTAEFIEYSTVLVNPGRVPLIVTSIKENIRARDGAKEWDVVKMDPVMNFEPPPAARPPSVYISQLPWVIETGNFAICTRRLDLTSHFEYLKGKELRLKAKFEYFVNEKPKSKEVEVPLRIGFEIAGEDVVLNT